MRPFDIAFAQTPLRSIESASSESPSDLMQDHSKVCQALTEVTEVIKQLPSVLPVAKERDVIDQGLRDCDAALTALHEHYRQEGATAGKTFELALGAVRTIDATRDTLQKSKVEPSVVVTVLEKLGRALGLVTAIVAGAAALFSVVPGVVAGAVAVSAVVAGCVGRAWGHRHAEEARALMHDLERADAHLKKELKPFVDATTRLISAVTRAKIEEHLDPTTRAYGGGLIHPRSKMVDTPVGTQGVQGVHGAKGTDTHPAMIMVADLDGSDVRGVIAALWSGKARATERGCELIAIVLKAEAVAAKNANSNGLIDFQQNTVIRDALTELKEHLTFHEGHTELVFVGDACFDRFGVNDRFQHWLQGELSAKGARYMLGNHDDIEVTLERRRETDPHAEPDAQYGDYVSREIPLEEWQKHIQRVFQRAYYSPATKILTTHQGATLLGDYILWAGGYLRAEDYRDDPQKFEADINAQKRIALTKPRGATFTLDEKKAIMTLIKMCDLDFLANRGCNWGLLPKGQTQRGGLSWERFLQSGEDEENGLEPVWYAPEDFDWHAAAEYTESKALRKALLRDFRPSDDDCLRVGKVLRCHVGRGHTGFADETKPGLLAMNSRSLEAEKDFSAYLPFAVEVFLAPPPKVPPGVSVA
ncbi:hypothetical protein [Pandoraea oxalativorans]|uniref:Uncharacterized protein n=1 Tax=Pandoraea oxalativorans TaxID=573737 RepID=A0A0G3IC92_9BURK|nr:hypothetical protein [Pandoraea oxalativorans]AKK24812.1 hypothetical protein MB84_28950 [Pandoraea oxalativorans]